MTTDLGGATVLVTRPVHQSATLVALIQRCGGTAISFPCIEIVPLDGQRMREQSPASRLARAQSVIFTSPNAAQALEACWAEVAPDATMQQSMSDKRLVAVGPATQRALAPLGLEAAIPQVGQYNTQGILALEQFRSAVPPRGDVLIVRGVDGREQLPNGLREQGWRVETLDVYERAVPCPTPASLRELRDAAKDIDFVLISSLSSAVNLFRLVDASTKATLLRASHFVAASDRIARCLERDFVECRVSVARAAGSEDFVARILELLGRDGAQALT
ncbi:MAG: uroporphyrinogen-III synthase [Gammaproteobacteria bacterium]|nr:uroporphyrinogen-III synthase [Gammaproteobacteria bacterium]